MFGKLFESTFTGSMCGAGPVVFAVWAWVVAHSRGGEVEINPRLLATVIGCEEAQVEEALLYLTSPDPKSRTKTEDGRRMVREAEYLYRVVNFAAYRQMRDKESRREQTREATRRWREAKRVMPGEPGVSRGEPPVSHVSRGDPSTEYRVQSTEAETELSPSSTSLTQERHARDSGNGDDSGETPATPEAAGGQRVFVWLPLRATARGPGRFPVTEDWVAELQRGYPEVNVRHQLRLIAEQLKADPERRPSGGSLERYVARWLTRALSDGVVRRGPREQGMRAASDVLAGLGLPRERSRE